MKLDQRTREAIAALSPEDLAEAVSESGDVEVLDVLTEREALEAIAEGLKDVPDSEALVTSLQEKRDRIAERFTLLQQDVFESEDYSDELKDKALALIREQAGKLGIELPELKVAESEEPKGGEGGEGPEGAEAGAKPKGEEGGKPAGGDGSQEGKPAAEPLTADEAEQYADDREELATAIAEAGDEVPDDAKNRAREALRPRIHPKTGDLHGREAIREAVTAALASEKRIAEAWSKPTVRVSESQGSSGSGKDDSMKAAAAAL